MRLAGFPCAANPSLGGNADASLWTTQLPSCYATLLILLVLVAVALYAVYRDYLSFINLGPGGTPSNFYGYLRVSFLKFFALRNPYLPSTLPIVAWPEVGFLPNDLLNLPHRAGIRPQVTGIAPHRQTTQQGSPTSFSALVERIRALQAVNPASLRLGTSCFEKHGTGLFAVVPVNRTCSGEVCHAHASDGSLHMTLHPADARIVLERGWGERHPLANGGWLTRFVPMGFVMIYAPRTPAELEVVMHIVHAATWWVSGRTLRLRSVAMASSKGV
ncbi:MAG: hypothetical protein M4579_004609 [Chaenotheca gracillima]|nr:MAG: hypothetical protein M4579_004609 [Chaenotheca gracillima]